MYFMENVNMNYEVAYYTKAVIMSSNTTIKYDNVDLKI